METRKKTFITKSEATLAVAGALLLLSVYIIAADGQFSLFILAKALYGIGVILLFLRK